MKSLYVSGIMTVCLRKVINVVNVSGIMTKCLFKKGVYLRKLNKVVFVCIWDHD